jgi:acetyltransferase-like isoleucine patch superfamily enzyme
MRLPEVGHEFVSLRSRVDHARGVLAAGNTHTWVYPNCRLKVATEAALAVGGRLDLGLRYEGGRYYDGHVILARGARLTVAGHFQIYTGCQVWVNEGATLALGSGYANYGFNLSCFEAVSIGNECMISENVTIRDSDNHTITGSRSSSGPITIGNHVWIGLNATILKDVTIGDGAVIAAGAVVVRDVPARSLVAGVPARVIRTDIDWS